MKTIRQNDLEHARNHWEAKYGGPHGAVAEAHARYVEAVGDRDRYVPALVGYMSTLFAAHNSQLAQFYKFWKLYLVLWYRIELADIVKLLIRETDFELKLAPSDKDVLIATLNLLGKEQELAVKLGYELLNDVRTPPGITWLATARMASMKGVPKTRQEEYRCRVRFAVNDLYFQRELGWKTVNRLARMIGDERMVVISAKFDGSRDIKMKSRAWRIAHYLFLN